MEEENPKQKLKNKLSQSIERSAELITNNKHYEFAQKIKMLAQRKQQTNKLTQAQILLQLGIQKMLSQQQVDYNATHDLIIALIELYQANKQFWEKQKADQLYKILTLKENNRNHQYFLRILKNITSSKDAPSMNQFVISHFQREQQFHRAQSLLVKEDLSRVSKFLERWHEKIDNDQYAIIVCRMAILKGFYGDSFDQSMVLLSELDTLNPFVKFTKFLILSVQMKSRESYQKIGECYKKFLKSDQFFEDKYQAFGKKFFNKQKAGLGILGLFEK